MSLRRPLAAVLAVSVLALTGCGVTGTGISPGAAVSVNGTSVSVDEVDEVAGSVCAVLSSDPRFEGQVVSGSSLRNAAQRSLALDLIADQLLDEYDVTLPASASDGSDQYRLSYGDADPEDVDRAEPVFVADQRFYNVLVALGTEDAGAEADDAAVIAAGVDRVQAWQDAADIETNPLFSAVEIGDEQIIATRDDLAVATSDFAVDAGAAEAPEGFAATLPASQRCGG